MATTSLKSNINAPGNDCSHTKHFLLQNIHSIFCTEMRDTSQGYRGLSYWSIVALKGLPQMLKNETHGVERKTVNVKPMALFSDLFLWNRTGE